MKSANYLYGDCLKKTNKDYQLCFILMMISSKLNGLFYDGYGNFLIAGQGSKIKRINSII